MNVALEQLKKSETRSAAAKVDVKSPSAIGVLKNIPVPDLTALCHSTHAGDQKSRDITLSAWKQTRWNTWQRLLAIIEKRYASNLHKK